MIAPQPSRGDIWSINFDPTTGREQSGTRPALILSVDKFNRGPAELLVVLPLTSKDKHQPLHVAIVPPEGGVTAPSFIKCDDIRSVSKLRLKRILGRIGLDTMRAVEERLRILLDL